MVDELEQIIITPPLAAIDILDQSPPGSSSSAPSESTKSSPDSADGARRHWIEFASANLKAHDEIFPVYPMYKILYDNFDTGKDAKGITITYRTYYRDTLTPKRLKSALKEALRTIVKELNAKGRFEMVLLSEYDNNCNMHWHGYFKGLNRKETAILHARLTQMIGFNKIEHNIKSWSMWTNYIMKNFDEETDHMITRGIIF